jgi:hypothetical protein
VSAFERACSTGFASPSGRSHAVVTYPCGQCATLRLAPRSIQGQPRIERDSVAAPLAAMPDGAMACVYPPTDWFESDARVMYSEPKDWTFESLLSHPAGDAQASGPGCGGEQTWPVGRLPDGPVRGHGYGAAGELPKMSPGATKRIFDRRFTKAPRMC